MSTSRFSENTQLLLSAAHINTYPSVADVSPEQLLDAGIEFCVSDYDGVIAPYGEPANQEALAWLAEAATTLPKGAAVVSNNWRPAEELSLPNGVSFHRLNPMRPWNAKPLPFGVNKALALHGARPEQTFAIGDGIAEDLVAYKLAGIGMIGIVKSLGGHKAQEAVRNNFYAPICVPLGATALKMYRSQFVAV